MSKVGYVVIIKRSGEDGDSYPMCHATCTIGKHMDSDIRVQLHTVSAKHASISVLPDGKCVITSLSETNPVQVNREVLHKSLRRVLCHKDEITVGDRLLRWEYSSSSPMHPHFQTCPFVFSTPTKFVGMSTPRSANTAKRKKSSRDSSASSTSERKRVSFGPYLSPEQFDQQLPTSTPVRKGEKPNFSTPVPVGSPMVLAPRQAVKVSQAKASSFVAHSNVHENTPTKSLLRRRSPTPIKPYLAKSLGFAVPGSAAKKTLAKSPAKSPKGSPAPQPRSPKVRTPSLILKQKKLVKSHQSSSRASYSPKTSRSRSESPRGRAENLSKVRDIRSRSVGPSTKGKRDPSSSKSSRFSRSASRNSGVQLAKSGNKLKTPKKKRDSSFVVTNIASPSNSSDRMSSSTKKARSTSFNVTSMSPKSSVEKPSIKRSNSLSPKKTDARRTTPKSVKSPVSANINPAPSSEASKTPKSEGKNVTMDNTPKSSLKRVISVPKSLTKKIPSPKRTPKSQTKKTPSPKKTPKSLTEKTPSPKKSPKSFTKRTPSPKKTPKSLTKRTPSPKKTPKSLTKKTPSPKKTPKSLTKKTHSPKKTPKSLTKKTPSPKKSPKSLTKRMPSPTSVTKKTPLKKTPKSLAKKTSPKHPVEVKSPKSLTKMTKRETATPAKSTLKSTSTPERGRNSPRIRTSEAKVQMSTDLKSKTPRLAWGRSSFASVVKRGRGRAVDVRQPSIMAKRALKAITKAREFKVKKNRTLNKKNKQVSGHQLTQDVPKKFPLGAVSSTGHANSPAPIVIYKKTQKTPGVYRKGRKSSARLASSTSALDLSGVEALMASPVVESSLKSPKRSPRSAASSPVHTPKSATKSTASLKSTPEAGRSQALGPKHLSPRPSSKTRAASKSLSPKSRSATKSLSSASTSKISKKLAKSARKSLPIISKSSMKTSDHLREFRSEFSGSMDPNTALWPEQMSLLPNYSLPASRLRSTETPRSLKSQGKIVKTRKSGDSNLRLVRSLVKTPQESKSASAVSASVRQTLLSMEACIASPASQSPNADLSSSNRATSARTPYNSPKQISSPLFMPSLAENGSRLGDFTSRKSLGIQPSEPREPSARRTRSLGGPGELTPTELRKLFTSNAMNAKVTQSTDEPRSKTSSPSSRSSSRLDFSSVETPNITQERFISPLGTPHYRQPDAMLLSSLTGKRSASSPAGAAAVASSSIRARGSNVAIVSPIQRQVTEMNNQSPDVSNMKQLFRETTSPYSSYSDVAGVKKLLRTQRTPKDDLRNVSGLKKLLQARSPTADYTDVQNIKRLFASNPSVSINDSTLASLSALVTSPAASDSPLKIHEVLNVVSSPPKQITSPIRIVTSKRSSSVLESPGPSKVPILVDISNDDDVDQTPRRTVQQRESRRATPASATRGMKRSATAFSESPVRRNTRAKVGAASPISNDDSFAKTHAKSPAKSASETPQITPAKSPKRAAGKSQSSAKVAAKSPAQKSPTKSLDKSSHESPNPPRRTRGRAARAKATSPVTEVATSKTTRRGRGGKTVAASTTPDASPTRTNTPSAVVTPPVTRRGRGAQRKAATPVSPSKTPGNKSPTPVKRATRGRKAAAVVSTPVKKISPAKKTTSSVKPSPQKEASPKKSPTPVKRTTRGRRAAAVKSTPVKVSPVKKVASPKTSNKAQTPIKGTPKSIETLEKSPRVSPKKKRGRKPKIPVEKVVTPVKASSEESPTTKSPKRSLRSRAAAKKASPRMTKTAAAKKNTRQTDEVTDKAKGKSSPQKTSPVKTVSIPPAPTTTRGRKAAAAQVVSSKTPSPARTTRQTRRRAAAQK